MPARSTNPSTTTKAARAKKAEPTPPRPRRAKKERPAAPAPDPAPASPQIGAQPVDDKYAPKAWGNAASEIGGPQDLELPSGQLVLARKPGLQQLMVEGVLHRMDNLTALVDSKHVKKGRTGPESINIKTLLGDTKAMEAVLHTVDRVMCAVVIKPPVQMSPNDITRRQPGVIYADTVGIDDKMFIFNWALGGSSDLERFRRESAEVVGSLVVGDAVAEEAE